MDIHIPPGSLVDLSQSPIAFPGSASTLAGAATQTVSISNSSFLNVAGNSTITNNSTHNTTNIYYANPPPPPPNARDLVEHVKARLERMGTSKYRKIQQQVAQQRTKGTGAAFQAKREVQDWYTVRKRFLWVRGGPGVGKTCLSCGLVEQADSIASKSKDEAVVCVYLRHDEQQTAWEITLGIIIQLVHWSIWLPAVPALVEELLDRHERIDSDSKPSLSDLEVLLNDILKEFRKASIFIDGLDEMKQEVQAQITEIVAATEANVLFTSRQLILLEEIVEELRGEALVFLDIVAEEVDLDLFIEDSIKRTPGFNRLLVRGKVKEEVVKTVKAKAEGMFLHAYLHMKALQACVVLRRIREVLDTFPRGIDALYDVTVKRIRLLPEDQATLGLRVLIWIVNAKRLLTMEELQRAVAVCPETYEFDIDLEVMEEYILSACCGLISIETEKREVRLIHFTAQSSLPAILAVDEPHPLDLITRTCLTHLSECNFQNLIVKPFDDLHQPFESNPLLRYSHQYGPHHAREGIRKSPELYTYVDGFVRKCESFPYFTPKHGLPTEIHHLNQLHVATLFNMPEVVVHLVQDGWDVNICSKESWHKGGRTCLTIAASEGVDDVLNALLGLPGVDINTRDNLGITPLIAASIGNHVTAVRALMLTDSIDIHQDNRSGHTALHLASSLGLDAVVELLLTRSDMDDVNKFDMSGSSALISATEYRRTAVVKRLLAFPGINVNHQNSDESSALIIASQLGEDEIVRLLLSTPGIDVNLRDEKPGKTALMEAASWGNYSTVELLLRAPGIAVDQKDNDGCSALVHALSNKHYAIVKLLLGFFSFDVDFKNDQECTAWIHSSLHGNDYRLRDLLCASATLILATCERKDDMVALFLDAPGIDVNLCGHNGRTALMVALACRYEDTAKLLLGAPGISANQVDHEGRTPLIHATISENEEGVKMVLDTPGVLVNQADNDGRTALIYASLAGYHSIAKLILSIPSVDVNHQDSVGWFALVAAASNANDDIVETLLAVPEIDVNAQDKTDGWPAVFYAAYKGYQSTLSVFLDHPHLDLGLKTFIGETILVFVLSYEFRQYHEVWQHRDNHNPQPIIDLLLDIPGVEDLAHVPDDKHGWTPLLLASKFGYPSIVERLLDIPAVDVDVTNKDGENALGLALEGGHEDVVKILRAAGAIEVVREV